MSHQSKRERIMQHLQDRFTAMQVGVNGYSTTWNAVVRRPLTKQETAIGDAVALFDVDEEKTPEIGFYRCSLRIQVEFFCTMLTGDDPSTELNRMLLDVQRCMRTDVTCGGLGFNILELRNELDVDGPADRLVAGVVEFQVQYRHMLDDPRLP